MEILLEASFSATTETLGEMRAQVSDACRRARCTGECAAQMVLATNEACMNVIQHGYQFAADKQFTLHLAVDDGVLLIDLLDNGRPVTAADLRPRELDDLRPGGLGVRFMREMMDSVDYRPAPDGFTNLLQLTKRIF